jgi:AbrB family looped-hinge helix DNA binding protein
MSTVTLKIQARGVITLPKKIQERAGLSSGSVIDIEARDGEVIIRPISRLDPDLARALRDAIVDLKAGRATPVFSSLDEFDMYMKAEKKGSRFRGSQK